MKKFFKYALILFAAAGVLASCKKEVEDIYTPASPDVEDCLGVYFPTQEAAGAHTYDPSMERTISVTVSRGDTKEAVSVPYTFTVTSPTGDATSLFSAPDKINFAAGQTETSFDITFENAEEGVSYAATLLIDDPQYASIYTSSPSSLNFSILIVSWQDFLNPKTNEPAIITLTEEWWGETHTATLKYYEVAGVRTAVLTSNETDEDGNPTGIWGDTQNVGLTFRWYVEDQDGFSHKNDLGFDFLEVPKQYFGFDYSGWGSKPEEEATSPIYVYDYPWYWVERGYPFDGTDQGTCWLDEANRTGNTTGSYPVGYYDGNGGFFFNLRYYIPGVGGFSPPQYDVVGIAEGFVRTDYSMAVWSDFSEGGETPIYIETGVDVSSIKYAIYEGELTSTQAANKAPLIEDGTDASVEFSEFETDEEAAKNYATFNVSPEKSGDYTLVAVAYDAENNVQNSAYTVFRHITAEDTEEYAVKISVGTEPTSARYEADGYTGINSFSYWVNGEDLTEVHMAVVSTANFEKDSESLLAELKANADYAVSAAILEEINATGGYATLATDRAPLTSYTVMVWATNGSLEDYVTAEFTTDGLPYEYVCTGTYTYDAWWAGADDAQELYIDPNYENTYVLTNWGGGVDFKFEMKEDGEIHIPTFYIGADHSSYGSVYYVDPFDWYSESSLAADEEKAVHSYYDAETNTYNFHIVLAVSAGSFGHFWESFTPNEEAAGAPAKVLKSGLNVNTKDVSKAVLPARWIKVERNPQPLNVKTTVSYNRKPAKEGNRTAQPVSARKF